MRGLDGIADFTNGLALQRFPPDGDEWLPVIKIAEMRRGYTEKTGKASADLDPRYIVEDGDVLFSWSGSLALVLWAHGRGALNQHLFKVTSDEFPRWFYWGWLHEHLVALLDEWALVVSDGNEARIGTPGRSLVGRAMVAIYTVGARKEIPGVRTYVSVDGGMADNVRPAMYGSEYEAVPVDRPLDPATETVTIAGKYCESGDILVRDAELPRLEPGELVALPASGGYNLAMASNYNMALRPPVVAVREGEARLLQRRETIDDLVARDVL